MLLLQAAPTPAQQILDTVHAVRDRLVGGGFGGSFGRSSHFSNSGVEASLTGPGAREENPGDDEDVKDAGEKDCDEQRANPIVLTTGNKIESTIDFASSGDMGLYLRRTYNHYWAYPGIFGKHWVTNFDLSLVRQGSNLLWAQRPDGRRIKYIRGAAGNFREDKALAIAFITQNIDGTFTHYTEDRMIEEYNGLGFVTSVKNRQNVGWDFTYSNNYLQQVTHTSQRSVVFTWTGTQLTRVTDPNGAQFNYTYDTNQFGPNEHRLKTATLPGVPTTRLAYTYENSAFPGALTGVFHEGVRYSTFDYDGQGRADLSEHSGAVDKHTFTYSGVVLPLGNPPPGPPPPGCIVQGTICDAPEVPDQPVDAVVLAERIAIYAGELALIQQPTQVVEVVETNPLGKQTTYRFDDGELIEIQGAASTYCAASFAQRSYDARRYPLVFEDFNGNQTVYTHSNRGHMESKVEASGSSVARTTTYDWDITNNRIDVVTINDDHRTTYGWTSEDRLQSETVRNLSPTIGISNQDRTVSYSYTEHSNGLVATMKINGPLAGTGDEVTYSFSTKGDLTSVSNSLNQTITHSQHNERGQVGQVLGVNGDIVDYLYDDRGRITKMTTHRNGGLQDTTFTYANVGLLESITYPDGQIESFTYDESERLKTASQTLPNGVLDVRELTYDNGSNVTRTEVKRNGTVIYSADVDYDELNRVRGRRGNGGQNETYKYDTNNNLKEIEQTLGQKTVLDYDELNRLKSRTDALLGLTQISYDLGDRIVQVIDPRLKATNYEFDGFGQLWELSSPDTGVTTQTWSAEGLRTGAVRADNGTLTYVYDTLGRATSVTATSGGQSQTNTTTWDLCPNGKGQICALSDPHQTLTLAYTLYGELSQQTANIGGDIYTHGFTYEGQGRLATATYPGNVSVSYSWLKGRVTNVDATINSQSVTLANQFQFTTFNDGSSDFALDGFTFGNGANYIEFRDLDGRLTNLAGGNLKGLLLDYDANNRVESITNFRDPALNQSFGYDDLNRLTSANSVAASNPLVDQTFLYDENGNRTLHTRNTVNDVYTVNTSNNRLNSITGGTPRSYTHRPTGQVETVGGAFGGDLIFGSSADGGSVPANVFGYDPFSRLSSIVGPDINATYQVAATGMRVAKTVKDRGIGPDQTTHFIYGLGGQLMYEKDLSSGEETQHLYLNGRPLAVVRNSTPYYVLPDHLGRPEALADANQQEVWRAQLRAFDRRVVIDSIGGYQVGFPGQYHDEETGFAYNVIRDYDPATGRYIQSDPIGLAGGLNTYGYVGGNPLSFVDPLGLAASASGAFADCLKLIFGQDATGVKVRNKKFFRNRFVTTRRNSIRLPPDVSTSDFFSDGHNVLHEYFHVLRQWNTGDLTRRGYVAEVVRSGSWDVGNKFEDSANAFASTNLTEFRDCLDKSGECAK